MKTTLATFSMGVASVAAAANWASWKYVNSQALDPGALSFVFAGAVRNVKAFDSNYDELYTRPLCAYPKVAAYNGSGSIEDAANFSCQ